MIKFSKVRFKGVAVKKVDRSLVQKDMLTMFWCLHYQQYTCVAQCVFKYRHYEEYGLLPCKRCSVRKANFAAYRKPRIIRRKPREVASVND